MPTSRKRNKGRDRKAKKEEAERLKIRNLWQGWIEENCSSAKGCDHGCDVAISDDHPVSSFMDQYMINSYRKGMYGTNNLRNLFETHTHILNNEHYRKLILDILIRIGTNMLLLGGSDMTWPICLGQSIMVLEHYNSTAEVDLSLNHLMVVLNWRDVGTGSTSSRRGVLKFFRKRTSCKCLKKMHLEARKTMPKMGICSGCAKEYERAVLSFCSRCKYIDSYCSRECQVADWPEHKTDCDTVIARIRKRDVS